MSTESPRSPAARWIAWVVVASMVFVAMAASPVSAAQRDRPNDPTSIEAGCYVPDIGTVETALGISSSVDEVCFGTLQLVDREHMKFYAVDLSISGVDSSPFSGDCGFFDADCGHRQASYEDIPVTLWFPRNWGSGNNEALVQYQHPGSSFAGEEMVGLGAIQQGMAYTAHGGQAEGAFGTIVDGPFAGEPVPLLSSSMTRDVGAVASDWLDRHAGAAADLKYITGWSAGGWVMSGLMAGNLFGAQMGNNHADPDDLSSAPYYDAALYIGAGGGPVFGPNPGAPGATATAVPSIYLQGEQEGTSIWRDVANWIDFVGDAQASSTVAIWSLRGHGHVPMETITAPNLDERNLLLHDLHGPVVAAALNSLHRAVTKGDELTSYLGGEIVTRQPGDPLGADCLIGLGGPDPDRLVRWTTLDGEPTFSSFVPVHADDVAFYGNPFIELFDKQPCEEEIDALQRIQSTLTPEPAIVPPLAANRVGPVHIIGSDVDILIAGAQFDVCAEYGNLNAYVGTLRGAAAQLQGQGVWKPLKGSTGVRITDTFADAPWIPVDGPHLGVVGTFQEQGCE